MIKLLLSGKQLLLFIVIAWSLLIFVGYNVLTVEATSEKYDRDEWVNGITPDENPDADNYSDDSREQVHRYCADEGYYDNNKKFCDKLVKGEDDTVFANEQGLKGKELEEEKAAQEDALCDNEDADTTSIEICKSEDRKNNQQKNEREWYYNENTNQYEYLSDEEIKEHNMEAESEIMQGEKWGPETPIEPPSEPYPTTEEPVIEDWSNTVSDEEQEKINKTVRNCITG